LIADLLARRPVERAPASASSAPSDETDLVCPECGGAIRSFREHGVFRFHCRVGHDFSAESMYAAQDARLESALWTAIRTLEESASLARRLAKNARATGAPGAAARFEARERAASARAERVREAILSLTELDVTPTIGESQPVADEEDARRPKAGERTA
jgi:two-component system chemotaxis response regulator CheB